MERYGAERSQRMAADGKVTRPSHSSACSVASHAQASGSGGGALPLLDRGERPWDAAANHSEKGHVADNEATAARCRPSYGP
jgi:hypothetical protein